MENHYVSKRCDLGWHQARRFQGSLSSSYLEAPTSVHGSGAVVWQTTAARGNPVRTRPTSGAIREGAQDSIAQSRLPEPSDHVLRSATPNLMRCRKATTASTSGLFALFTFNLRRSGEPDDRDRVIIPA